MLCKEKFAVWAEIRTKHINTMYDAEFFNIKPGGTYSNQQALKD